MTTLVARYARKSTRQKDRLREDTSLERQLADAERFIVEELRARVAPQTYEEVEGTSGAEFRRRPAWAKLMKDAEAGLVQGVVMMAPSRGARAIFRGGAAFQDLCETGCKVWFYDRAVFGAKTEPLDLSSSFKRQMFGMILFGDEHQREQVRADTVRGMIQRVKDGHSPGVKTYGYRTVKVYTSDDARSRGEHTHAEIEKDPEEAKVVKDVFVMAARRMGNLRIARALNDRGVVGPGGGQWSKENIRGILANRLYTGTLIWGRTRSRDYHGETGVRRLAPESEWVVQPIPRLRIVDDELWSKVRALKAAALAHYGGDSPKWRAHGGGRNVGGASEHPLNVVAKCGLCGKSMLFMKRNKAGSSRLYYCSTTLRKGACSNRRGVPADLLEELVRKKVRGLSEEQLWQSCQARAARWNADHALKKDDRDRLGREAKRLEAAVDRLTDAIERGEDVGDRLRQRQRELADVRARLAEPEVTLNRKVFKDGLKTVKVLMGGDVVVEETATERGVRRKVVNRIAQDEATGYREALRSLGVSKIVVTPGGGGWGVRIHGDAGPIVAGGSDAPGDDRVIIGHAGGPSRPPI